MEDGKDVSLFDTYEKSYCSLSTNVSRSLAQLGSLPLGTVVRIYLPLA